MSIRFPLVCGRFRLSRSQILVFVVACILVICFYLLSMSANGAHEHGMKSLEQNIGQGVLPPPNHQGKLIDLSQPTVEAVRGREDAANVVGRFEDPYKHVNYSRFLVLQEKVRRLGELVQEKTEQLKRWGGWGDSLSVGEYFLTKKRIVQALPFKWEISRENWEKLTNDREYFNQLREAVNRTREIALRYKPIYDLQPASCQCSHTDCSCCTRLFVRPLNVDEPTCLNFSHNTQGKLHSKITMGGRLAFSQTQDSKEAGEICLSDSGDLLYICVQYLNLTLTVHPHHTHKTEWQGCVEFHLNLQTGYMPAGQSRTTSGTVNDRSATGGVISGTGGSVGTSSGTVSNSSSIVTIASYPVGCFLTSHQNEHDDLKLGFGV